MNKDTITVVEKILRNHPETRDSDSKLCFMYYAKIDPVFYIPGEPYHAIDVVEFFKRLNTKRYTSMSSITRARRKVQETFAELRGSKWKSRQKHQKTIVNETNKWEDRRRHEVNSQHHINRLGYK